MAEMVQIVLQNLGNVYIGIGIFALAFISNVLLSVFYNVKISGVKFDIIKLANGMLKMLTFCVGIGLLCITITTLPIFANYVGFTISNEYIEFFSNITIISAFLIASCKYVVEAVNKLNLILNNKE